MNRTVLDSVSRRVRRLVRTWGGPALGLALLLASVWGVDWTGLIGALRVARPAYLFLALVSVIVTLLAKAARWRALYGNVGRVAFGRFLAGIVVGQTMNAVMPGRFGDVTRIYMGGREQDLGYSRTFGTLLAEKMVDGLTLVVLLLLLLPAVPAITEVNATRALLVSGGMAAALLAVLVGLRWERARQVVGTLVQLTVGRWRPSWASRLQAAWHNASLATFSGAPTWLWTVAIWGIAILTNQCVYAAVQLPLPWTAAPLLTVILLLGGFVRIVPGQLGVFEYLTIITLRIYGVEPSGAFACGLLLHVLVMGVPMILGIWALRREGVFWSDLAQLSKRTAAEASTLSSEAPQK